MKDENLELSAFEREIIRRIFVDSGMQSELKSGFLDRLRVAKRRTTGVGLFIDFVPEKHLSIAGDSLLGADFVLACVDAPMGVFSSLLVEEGKPHYLEMATCGDDVWDGDTAKCSFPKKCEGAGLFSSGSTST